MNFDFKVIAKSFPAIALVVAAFCFFLGEPKAGVLFAFIAIVSFGLSIAAKRF